MFLEVASRVNNTFEKAAFVIVGNIFSSQRGYYNSLRKKITQLGITNIEFIGYKEDIRLLLKDFDLFICTSKSESGPMTLWEAMCMEKAVVSTNVGDVAKYVIPDYSGAIVPIGDAQAMAEKILELTLDKSKRLLMGKHARQIIVNNFDVSICTKKQYLAYKNIINN